MANEYDLKTEPAVATNANFSDQTVLFGSVLGQATPDGTPPDPILLPAVRDYMQASGQYALQAAVFN
jgi:hypothetical protein